MAHYEGQVITSLAFSHDTIIVALVLIYATVDLEQSSRHHNVIKLGRELTQVTQYLNVTIIFIDRYFEE